MNSFYLRREYVALKQSPIRWASLVLFTAFALWALVGGLQWQSDMEETLANTPADLLTTRDAWMADLRKIETGEEVSPYAARPMNLTALAVHRPGALAALAFRNESIDPHSALVNGWRSEASLFRRYEVQGPSALWAGKLDLSFIVIVLMPLFILVLSFDVLSSERAAGRYPLFLVQGGRAGRRLAARLLVVSLPIVSVLLLCVVVAAVANGASGADVLIWSGVCLAYAFFWAGIGALIAVRFHQPVTGALAVLAAWATIVVLIPSGAQFAAQAFYPLPSRVSFLTDARDAEGSSRRNVEERAEIYMAEHPGQSDAGDEEVPGFYRTSYLSNVDINQRVAPIVETLESQQAAQREFAAKVAYLSPAMLASQALHAASGTGPLRAAQFREQTRAYLRMLLTRIGPATVSKSRISSDAAREIPEFSFQPSRDQQWLPALGWPALLTILLLIMVRRLVKAEV